MKDNKTNLDEFMDWLDNTEDMDKYKLETFRSNWDALTDDEKWAAFATQYMEGIESLRDRVRELRSENDFYKKIRSGFTRGLH